MAYVPRHRRTPDTNHASSPVGPRTLEQMSMETGALGTRPLRGAAQARSSRSALLRCAACSKAKESFDFDPNQLTRGESRQCFECLVGGTWALAEENRHRRLDISTPAGRQAALAAYVTPRVSPVWKKKGGVGAPQSFPILVQTQGASTRYEQK